MLLQPKLLYYAVTLAVFALLSGQCASARSQVFQPLVHAHAHNDYLHTQPLFDALEQGFCSVEADVYLVNDQLLVAHDRAQLRDDRTLQSLYLEPLRIRVAENNGRVYRDGPIFQLMIDIKSDAEPTYLALHSLLESYSRILSSVIDARAHAGAVNVVISGNRPHSAITAQTTRYCGIDGRIRDLDSDLPEHLMPMISDNWLLNFQWLGEGPMPQREADRLADIVRRAHAKGRSVRFWATPENEALWQVLVDAKVDYINTDQLAVLAKFLRKQRTQ